MSDTITWTGQVLFTDSSDYKTTGVATLTLTPSVGVSNLPILASGESGKPALITSATATGLSAGSTPTVTLTQTNAGGPGASSQYTLAFGIPAGAAGSTGPSTSILSAPDVQGTATDKYTLVYNASASKMQFAPQKVPLLFQALSYTAYSGNAASSNALTSITIANTTGYDIRPLVWGYIQPTGTANCRCEAKVVLGSSVSSGDVLAYGAPLVPQVSGGSPVTVPFGPAFGNAIGAGSSYGLIAAGSTGVVSLFARQIASTSDSWGVGSTSASMFVMGVPVL